MDDGEATGLDGVTAELLSLELIGELPEISYHFHNVIAAFWASGDVPYE